MKLDDCPGASPIPPLRVLHDAGVPSSAELSSVHVHMCVDERNYGTTPAGPVDAGLGDQGPHIPSCLTRRHWPLAWLISLTLLGAPGGRLRAAALQPAPESLRLAMARALVLRDEAVRSGDQPYGAVVLYQDRIVGEAPSRVVTRRDMDAHAEREALRDAQRRLGRGDLAGCLLVSSSRPCRLCESAAARLQIARMIHGESLLDAGKPTP